MVWLQNVSVPILKADPVGGYVMARRFEWKQEAELAARQCLTLNLDKIVAWRDPILCDAPMVFLQDLLWYHRTCTRILSGYFRLGFWKTTWLVQRASSAASETAIDSPDLHALADGTNNSTFCCPGQPYYDQTLDSILHTKKWWETFVTQLHKGLSRTPSFDVVLTTHTFHDAVKEAGECLNCAPIAFGILEDFVKSTREAVMQRIDNASTINISYSRLLTLPL